MVPAALAGTQPERGALLVATERTHDTGFAETVILVLQHDQTRSVGLVVNRTLGEAVATLFPELKGTPAGADPLWAGGPVALGVNALVRSRAVPPGTSPILPGVFLLSDKQSILAFDRRHERTAGFRVYVGLSSWGPRQLEDEIARGLWKTVNGSAALIFDPRPETLWERLTKKAPQSR